VVWQETDDAPPSTPTSSMCDVVFRINCQTLPVDHAAELTQSICSHVPWLSESKGAGVHPIHVAGSQNGWERPNTESGEPLILSKRTRLRIRVPFDRTDQLIESLSDTTHALDEHQLHIVSGRTAPLSTSTTLFARYAAYTPGAEEEASFLQGVIRDCESIGYRPNKLLCGKSNALSTPQGEIVTRSILIADVPAEYSIPLQETGLGINRLMGCGILIPHKDTSAV